MRSPYASHCLSPHPSQPPNSFLVGCAPATAAVWMSCKALQIPQSSLGACAGVQEATPSLADGGADHHRQGAQVQAVQDPSQGQLSPPTPRPHLCPNFSLSYPVPANQIPTPTSCNPRRHPGQTPPCQSPAYQSSTNPPPLLPAHQPSSWTAPAAASHLPCPASLWIIRPGSQAKPASASPPWRQPPPHGPPPASDSR